MVTRKVTFIQDEDLKIQIDIKSISQAKFNPPKYDILIRSD